jgi:glucosylceramidase
MSPPRRPAGALHGLALALHGLALALHGLALALHGLALGLRLCGGRAGVRRARGLALAGLASVVLWALWPAGSSAAWHRGRRHLPAAGERVAVYLTTADLREKLARQPDVSFLPGAGSGQNNVEVDPAVRYQPLSAGFGVAMTDTAAFVLDRGLPASRRRRVMALLFSPTRGIGLSFLRVPIGGSDYVVGAPYTYDDMPLGQGDPTLAHFSLAHDRPYIIPMIRDALALNPSLSIMANPWTPPAWMKADDSLVSGTALGTLLPQYYGTFARYLVRFLLGYRAMGIPVRFLGVQNEPLDPLLFGPISGIPAAYLSAQDEGRLIADYLAPALRAAGLDPRVLAYDFFYNVSESYIPVVMGIAGHYVGGLAYHCYFSDPISMTIEHQAFPDEPEYETECSSYLSNIPPAAMAIEALRNWAQGVQLWNAALDQHYGPKIGHGCQGITGPHAGQPCIAPVIVDTTRHSYRLTSDFWALAQFSKFIRLGARRIASSTPNTCTDGPTAPPPCGLQDVAFSNPDGTQVLVATTDAGAQTLTVTEGGAHFSYTVPDGAIVTFVWGGGRPRQPRAVIPPQRDKVSGRGTVRVRVGCRGSGWCSGILTLSVAGRCAHGRRCRPRRAPAASRRVRVRAGRTISVRLALDRRGRRLLEHGGRLEAILAFAGIGGRTRRRILLRPGACSQRRHQCTG